MTWILRAVLAGVAAGLCSSPALPQTTTETIIRPDPLDFPAEREVIVREYIIREPVRPVEILEGGGMVRPGSIVPGYVPLESFRGIADPSLRAYGYFVSPDNKIVIVEPETRRVVRIISQ